MKQHRIFTKDMVIDSAFELLRERGWAAVTARDIAARLGSSTMPIYSHMKSLEELTEQLSSRSRTLLNAYQQRPYTDEELFNIAVGYVLFARDEPHLFRFLFLEREQPASSFWGEEMSKYFQKNFAGREEQAGLSLLSGKSREGLLRNSYIYTHGLAVLVHTASPGDWSDEALQECLRDAGEAFFMLEHQRTAGKEE